MTTTSLAAAIAVAALLGTGALTVDALAAEPARTTVVVDVPGGGTSWHASAAPATSPWWAGDEVVDLRADRP